MRNRCTLSLFLSIFTMVLTAQQQSQFKIDSIKALLQNSESVDRAWRYGELFSVSMNDNPKEAKSYLDSMFNYVEKHDDTLNRAFYHRNMARFLSMVEDNNSESLQNMKISTQLFQTLGKKELVNENYNNMAFVLIRLGNLEEATSYLIKALKIRDELGYPEEKKLNIYNKLGRVYGNLDNLERSNYYFRKIEKILTVNGNKNRLGSTLQNLGLNYKKMDSLNLALEYYKKAIAIWEESNNQRNLALIYGNLANLYARMDSLEKVIPLYDKALKAASITNNKMEYSRALNNKAAFFVDLKRYRDAIPLLEESIERNKNSGIKMNLSKNYASLANSYYGIGDFKKAFDYQTINFQYTDSIKNKESLDKINELETKYQTEKKEAEIALQEEEINTLNEKAKVDKLTKGLFAGGMASALALFGLSVFGYRQRIKKNRIAREKQEEIYRQEIAHKKKELASQTLHLVQKNTFLDELKENLENLKNSPDKFKMEFRRIVMLLKKEKASDKDWETFKTYFSEVHNDFDQKLKTLYADISEKEIRLAAFLRMNLTTKEIAATLNVLPDSILKSKYRLKKKLGLGKDIDLVGFLNTL